MTKIKIPGSYDSDWLSLNESYIYEQIDLEYLISSHHIVIYSNTNRNFLYGCDCTA